MCTETNNTQSNQIHRSKSLSSAAATTEKGHNPNVQEGADVLCYNKCLNFSGNIRFAAIAFRHLVENGKSNSSDNNTDLDRIAASILREVESYGGRLLGRTKRQTWKQLGQILAVRWIKVQLRSALSCNENL